MFYRCASNWVGIVMEYKCYSTGTMHSTALTSIRLPGVTEFKVFFDGELIENLQRLEYRNNLVGDSIFTRLDTVRKRANSFKTERLLPGTPIIL